MYFDEHFLHDITTTLCRAEGLDAIIIKFAFPELIAIFESLTQKISTMASVNVYLNYDGNCQEAFQSKDEADKIFNGLSKGGKVTMPMNKTFWGDYFGMCEDKFGVNWMMSFNENSQN